MRPSLSQSLDDSCKNFSVQSVAVGFLLSLIHVTFVFFESSGKKKEFDSFISTLYRNNVHFYTLTVK